MSSTVMSANREDYTRWRPQVHLMPPQGWTNDPCAPTYDPVRRQYHLAFQWNPNGWDWGDIAWGTATSEDLVNWKVSSRPSIQPSSSIDPGERGVFTGCMLPAEFSKTSDGSLTCFYTSARNLPIHYTLPYNHGCEQLRMANSTDGGLTWQRHLGNPILAGAPSQFSVTAWRDPYVFTSNALDAIYGKRPGPGLYGTLAGGVRDETPTIFLYALNSDDITEWSFLTKLIDIGPNFAPHPKWGDFGLNWEVTNIITLHDERGRSFEVVMASVEACVAAGIKESLPDQQLNRAKRSGRSQKWLHGQYRSKGDGIVDLEYICGGHLDYGAFYAANSFFDPVSKSQVVHGWILEDDLLDKLRQRQGWSGLISLARRISMTTITDVDPASIALLQNIPGFVCQDGSVTTLSITPDPRTKLLRDLELRPQSFPLLLPEKAAVDEEPILPLPNSLSQFELNMSLSVGENAREVGIHLLHSEDSSFRTTITYDTQAHRILVHRDKSCEPNLNIKTESEVAPHVLLRTLTSDSSDSVKETLDIKIFYDVSVLEIFINRRVAITTRVYPPSGTCFGVQPFVVSNGDCSSVSEIDDLSLWSQKTRMIKVQ